MLKVNYIRNFQGLYTFANFYQTHQNQVQSLFFGTTQYNKMDSVKEIFELLKPIIDIALILGAFFVKVPQVIAIWRSKSVKGLEEKSLYLDVVCCFVHVMYCYLSDNISFGEYGDTAAVTIWNIIIVQMFFQYEDKLPGSKNRNKPLMVYSMFALILTLIFAIYYVDKTQLYLLQLSQTPLLLATRGMQIFKNIKEKSTGSSSFITNFLIFGGTSYRLLQQITKVTIDKPLVLNNSIGAITSGIQVLLIIILKPKAKVTEKEL